jgi:hypothetical protein
MTGHAVAAMFKMMGKFKKDPVHFGRFYSCSSMEEKLYFVLFKHGLMASCGQEELWKLYINPSQGSKTKLKSEDQPLI